MAVNTQKLLPPSKLTTAERMSASYDKRIDDILNFEIKEKLIDVDKFFKKNIKDKKKKEKEKKKGKQRKKRAEKERNLETPKGIKGVEKTKSLIPKTGILDAVQRFATFTFLGYLLGKFGGETPKLLGILKNVGPVINTTEKIIGGIFEGIVGFIDAGYKAHDQMRALSKDIGGEKAQKVYDDFSSNFNRFLNAVLTFGLSELGRESEIPPEKKSGGGMVRGYARGGQSTRGGRVVGGAIGRTFKIQRGVQRPQRVQPEKVSPGKDVGGKLKIEKLYPNPKPTSGKRTPNPYKALTGVSESLDKGGWIGALMSAGVKVALGQKVNVRRIASTVSSGVESLSQAQGSSLDTVSRSILGMADGGRVPLEKNDRMMSGLLATLIQTRVNEALKNVTDELLKVPEATSPGRPGGGGDPGGGGGGTNIEKIKMGDFSDEDIDVLGRMIAAEAGNQPKLGKAGVLSVILNRYRLAKSGDRGYMPPGKNKDNVTLKDIIYAEGQFTPITDGRFDRTSSAAGKNALDDAISASGNDPQKFKQKLMKDLKLSEADAELVVRATAFSNPKIRSVRPFNTPEVEVGDHAFQASPYSRIGSFPGAISANVTKLEGESKVSADIKDFRKFRAAQFGASAERNPTAGGEYYQIRELGVYGRKDYKISPLADDLSYEIEEHSGAGHYENRAFDIPVPNSSAEGDAVAQYWRSKGYTVIWKSEGHYDHVHVEVPADKADQFFKIVKTEKTKLKIKKKKEEKTIKSNLEKIVNRVKKEKKLIDKRPWYDKLGLFGGAAGAASRASMRASKKQGGGFVGPQNKRNYSSLSMYPSYDDGGGMMVAIQPIIIEKPVATPTGGSQMIAFPIPVGVNNNMASLSR